MAMLTMWDELSKLKPDRLQFCLETQDVVTDLQSTLLH